MTDNLNFDFATLEEGLPVVDCFKRTLVLAAMDQQNQAVENLCEMQLGAARIMNIGESMIKKALGESIDDLPLAICSDLFHALPTSYEVLLNGKPLLVDQLNLNAMSVAGSIRKLIGMVEPFFELTRPFAFYDVNADSIRKMFSVLHRNFDHMGVRAEPPEHRVPSSGIGSLFWAARTLNTPRSTNPELEHEFVVGHIKDALGQPFGITLKS